ncbi:unnamed protein product [Rotaria sp. Silwood2]|nr:unnamed protein product [Rotaria sp. Silwood2]
MGNVEDDDFELPENWPEYDFHRKKSCVLSRIFSTCVTKAINHLELVQNAIERKDAETKKGTVKREVSFNQMPSSTEQLEIVGRGGHITDQHPHHDILEDEILDEVLLLLARLDRERLRLINLCVHEQQSRERLKENIDHWRLKRLHDLPLAVQKGSKKSFSRCNSTRRLFFFSFFLEHDACITDITELQWHIAYNARLAEKVFAKIDLSRTWHRQLEIEVNDIRQTIPLITEKVQTELTEIAKVDEALKETEHELMLSRAKNADTLDKCTRANQRAGTERDEIRGEIDKALKGLQRITTKLQASIDQHKAYQKTIHDAKVTVKKNDRAYEEEVKKRDTARADIASNKLKTTAHDLEATFNHITTQTNYMKKHIVEMDESRAMMETLTVKIRGEIQTAEADLAHENYNFGLVQAGEQEVVRVLQQCLQRQSTTDSLNKQLFQERSNYLSDKKICIEKALLLNTQLASTYRKTLYTYYEIKTRLMGKLEQRLDAVARVKDTRQLIELQARLHDALNFYFGIKNEYVEQRLDHLNRESHQNGLQLSQVQETIQSAVDHITKFLVDQVDFEAVHRDAMLKVHREELQEQQKVPV